jgi:hypothetical protein
MCPGPARRTPQPGRASSPLCSGFARGREERKEAGLRAIHCQPSCQIRLVISIVSTATSISSSGACGWDLIYRRRTMAKNKEHRRAPHHSCDSGRTCRGSCGVCFRRGLRQTRCDQETAVASPSSGFLPCRRCRRRPRIGSCSFATIHTLSEYLAVRPGLEV